MDIFNWLYDLCAQNSALRDHASGLDDIIRRLGRETPRSGSVEERLAALQQENDELDGRVVGTIS